MALTADENIPVNLMLTRQAYDKQVAMIKDQPVNETLGRKASAFLENQSNGGVFLTSDQIRNIEKVTGKKIDRGADVVACIQKANAMDEDSFVYKVRIDPIWKEPLEQKSVETGRSVDQLLTDAIAIGFENNWIYGMVPQNPPIFFTDSDLAFWQKQTGIPRPFGADITAAAKKERIAA